MLVDDLSEATLENAIPVALQNIKPGARIYVAFSGGLDSQLLLQLAAAYAGDQQASLTALHVNHGLSPDADQWQASCRTRCEKLGVVLLCRTVELGGINSANLEQRARQLRYDWFASILLQGDVLLTGHHLDDQAETLVLRLLRASGTRGLAAIPACRALGAGQLIRPFLWHSKVALQAYAEVAELSWIEDESNQCLDFDRNYIRHQVLPPLLKRWPRAFRQLARSAAHCRDDQLLLDDLADLDLSRVTAKIADMTFSVGPPLDLSALLELSRHRQRHMLQTVLRRLTGHTIPGAKMSEWLRQAAAYQPGGRNSLKLESINLVMFAGQMHFLRNLPDMTDSSYVWNPQQPLEIEPLGLSLRLETSTKDRIQTSSETVHLKPGESLRVHWRQGGERIRLREEPHSRVLKKQLQEQKVMPWLRNYLPLVSYDDVIIWSGALGDFSPGLTDEYGRRLCIFFTENKSNC